MHTKQPVFLPYPLHTMFRYANIVRWISLNSIFSTFGTNYMFFERKKSEVLTPKTLKTILVQISLINWLRKIKNCVNINSFLKNSKRSLLVEF